jgi:hypothetical protein
MNVQRERLEVQFEALAPSDRDERTATLTWYTGAAVRRFDSRGTFEMRFSMEPGAIRMERLASGSAPLLNSHRDFTVDDVIGVITKAWVENGRGKATVRFSKRADVDPIWQDVQDGILRNASMGVAIHAIEDVTAQGATTRQVLVTDWEPEEVSLVPIGADPGAGFKFQRATGPQEQTMEQTSVTDAGHEACVKGNAAGEQAREETKVNVDAERESARMAERSRIQELEKIGRAVNLDAKLVARHVEAGTGVEDFRKLALEELAKRTEATPIRSATAAVTRDEAETRRAGIIAALLHRYDPAVFPLKEDLGRDWTGLTLLDLARECLETGGTRTRRMPRHEIAKLALSTSDFPSILADVANKTLRQAYEAYPRTFLPFSRRRSAVDFKNINAVQLGEAPSLQKVNEKGEFTHGSIAESKETYKLATYGRIVSITRQVIINDDLGAFTRIPAGFGVAAATLESDTVWGIVTSNPNMGDGTALFHANHGNLLSGGGSALALAGLGSAMAAMAKQKGLDGITTLNVQGRYLAVPVALQLTAFQLVATNLAPAQSANVVPEYIRALMPIAEPRLDAASATAWYLFASPDQIDTIEYAYLEGQDGVYIETRQGFDVDGVEIKARLDFGAKAIDWRGMQKNAGA